MIWDGEQQITRTQNGKKGIDIPGFDTLVFKSNRTHQRVNFFNPKENDCLFKMTLFVNNKSIWQSGYCASGSGYYEIDIDKPLKAGEYPSYLQVECFRSDGTALNCAKVEVNLMVED